MRPHVLATCGVDFQYQDFRGSGEIQAFCFAYSDIMGTELARNPEGFSSKLRGVCPLQALADVFSDHEKFIHEELHPFFERSSNLENAPAWGIVDAAFLRHVMANIKR